MMGWRDIVAERFEKEIVLHALRILCMRIQNAPLILGIAGPPGEGKTYQCKLILKRLGIKIFSMSAGQFESEDAGKPAELIRETYRLACEYIRERKGNMAAIVIDDADVAFGNWGKMYQYTVNTQIVIGELMSMADRHVNTGDEEFVRVPIFMTGNDLAKIYSPLRRAGRMNFFYWEPSFEEKVRTVYFLFDFLNEDECTELVEYVNDLCIKNRMNTAPIAFYSELEAYQYDDIIWTEYMERKNNSFSDNIARTIDISDKSMNLTFEKLKEMAEKKLRETRLSGDNHINRNDSRQRRKYGSNKSKC